MPENSPFLYLRHAEQTSMQSKVNNYFMKEQQGTEGVDASMLVADVTNGGLGIAQELVQLAQQTRLERSTHKSRKTRS